MGGSVSGAGTALTGDPVVFSAQVLDDLPKHTPPHSHHTIHTIPHSKKIFKKKINAASNGGRYILLTSA